MAAEILNFLNARGSAAGLRSALDEIEDYPDGHLWPQVHVRELTGGGSPEVIVSVSFPILPSFGGVLIFTCHAGAFQLGYAGQLRASGSLTVDNVVDMTADGMPEVVYSAVTSSGSGGLGWSYVIVGWDGAGFANLTERGELEIFNVDEAWVVDTDGDGTRELVLAGWTCACYLFEGPQRQRTDYWAWDGEYFRLSRWENAEPEYRFQAVQDGDDASRLGDFDTALAFYQQAIFDADLKGWSPAEPGAGIFGTPLPPADPTEWARLEAYARYRIMLLHAARGHFDAASTVYETLQARFPDPRSGSAFAELASMFWEEYLTSQDLEAGCSAAIQHAERNQAEILVPLGSDFYGVLNRDYKAEDVCPFPLDGD